MHHALSRLQREFAPELCYTLANTSTAICINLYPLRSKPVPEGLQADASRRAGVGQGTNMFSAAAATWTCHALLQLLTPLLAFLPTCKLAVCHAAVPKRPSCYHEPMVHRIHLQAACTAMPDCIVLCANWYGCTEMSLWCRWCSVHCVRDSVQAVSVCVDFHGPQCPRRSNHAETACMLLQYPQAPQLLAVEDAVHHGKE